MMHGTFWASGTCSVMAVRGLPPSPARVPLPLYGPSVLPGAPPIASGSFTSVQPALTNVLPAMLLMDSRGLPGPLPQRPDGCTDCMCYQVLLETWQDRFLMGTRGLLLQGPHLCVLPGAVCKVVYGSRGSLSSPCFDSLYLVFLGTHTF